MFDVKICCWIEESAGNFLKIFAVYFPFWVLDSFHSPLFRECRLFFFIFLSFLHQIELITIGNQSFFFRSIPSRQYFHFKCHFVRFVFSLYLFFLKKDQCIRIKFVFFLSINANLKKRIINFSLYHRISPKI